LPVQAERDVPDTFTFTIAEDHPCLSGHFPGRPVVPGVVLLEQVLARIGVGHGRLRLPRVKFARPLLPGDPARIELDGGAPRWRFRVLRGDELLASGEVRADGRG